MKYVRMFLGLLLTLGFIVGTAFACAEAEQVETVRKAGKFGASSIDAKKIDTPVGYVPAPPEGGMTIRNVVYSAQELESDQKGLYWEWNASLQQLTLRNWEYKTSGYDMDPSGAAYILIDRLATINIVGNNDRAYIYSSSGLVITGKGRLTRGIIRNDGSGDVFINNANGISASITNKTGNIAFNNSMTQENTSIWATKGNVEIYSSNINAKYIDAGNNVEIFDSVVFTGDHASYNDLYASNVIKARNSVLIYDLMKGEGGGNIDSSVALFEYGITVRSGGRNYNYPDQYSLTASREINGSYTLPNLSYHGLEGYAIPKGMTLRVNSGYYIDFNDTLQIDGKISGDVRYRGNCDPEDFYVYCPLTVCPGEEIPVTVSVQPSNAHLTLHWTTNHPELVSIDRNGVMTLLPEAKDHIGEAVSISATSLSYSFQTRQAAFFISNVQDDHQLKLPTGLKVIEDEAFAGTDASEIIIPNGLIEIGSRIFDGCGGLKIIYMPDGAADALAEDTFEGCAYVSFLCRSYDGAAAVYAREHNIPYILSYRVGS